MSLLRLLTAGKSLVGAKESMGRYHLSPQRLLPRFGAKKDPFRATALPEQAQRPANVPAQAAIGCKSPEVLSATRTSSKQAQNGGWAGKCLSRVGALLSRRGKTVERAAIPRFNKPLVQGELSLDSVKVVRNDLRDSDLEFVVAKPVPSRGIPASQVVCAAGSGKVWNRVAGRLFGAGKV